MSRNHEAPPEEDREGLVEIALVGDLTERESELADKLLGVPSGGECVIYIDSPGGSPYCAMSLAALIKLRNLRATAVVTGECSSAALWPFAACRRRMVTPYSVLLFHAMKWQSEEHVELHEAAEWARHFAQLERDMDKLLVAMFGSQQRKVAEWIATSRYVSGHEIAATGLAELIDLRPLAMFQMNGAVRPKPKKRKRVAALRD